MDYHKSWLLLMRVGSFILGMPDLVLLVFSPTFMLGIWHGGEWLKRELAYPFYGWVERGSPIPGWILHV